MGVPTPRHDVLTAVCQMPSLYLGHSRMLDSIDHSQDLTKHRNKKVHLVFHDPKHIKYLPLSFSVITAF